VQSPQLDINTVAAGGGSRLFFKVCNVVLWWFVGLLSFRFFPQNALFYA